MRRKSLVVTRWLATIGLVLAGLAPSAWAGDESLKPKVLALNDVTGEDPLSGQFKALLDQPAEAKKLLAAAVPLATQKDTPLNYNAALLLAQLAADFKDMEKSEAFFRVTMDKAAKLQSTRKLLQAYGGWIEVLYDNKKYAETAKVCQELLELKVGDGKERVYFLSVTGRFGDTDFRQDEDYNPAAPLKSAVNRYLIQAVAKQGKYDQALKLVDNLVRARDDWQDRQLKGWVLREAGKFTEAAKTYEDIIERIGKDKNLEQEEKEQFRERFRYLLSNVYVDLNQIDRAAEQLKTLIAAKPNEPAYQNDLGYIWADHGQNLDEAEKLVRKALELDRAKRKKDNPKLKPEEDRDNGAYLDSLAWVLYKKMDYKEAKAVMLKAVEDKNSQHIEIFDHLGDIHLALGERDLAIQAWRRGLEVVGEGRRETERKSIVEKKLEKHSSK